LGDSWGVGVVGGGPRLQRVATDARDVTSTSQAAKLRRLAAWAAIALLALYLVALGGGFPAIYSVWLRIFGTALIGAILLVWLIVAWRRPAWRPATVLWPGFAAALIAFAVGIALSPTPRLGLEYLAYSVLLTCLYLLLVRLWADRFFQRRFGALAVGLTLFVCGLYIAIVASHWLDFWSLVGSIVTPPLRPLFEGLTLGNPSAVMTLAVLFLAPAVAHLGLDSIGRRIGVGLLVGLVLVVTLLSGSRAGWLGLAIGIGITALTWLLLGENRAMIRRLAGLHRVQVGLGVAAVVVIPLAVLFGPGIALRIGAGGETGRATFFGTAVRMFESAPITGVGPGGWAANRIVDTPAGEIDYYVPHAHSLYLQTAAEFGLVGIVAGIVAIGCVAWLIAGAIRDVDPVRRRFGWAALFSLAYFGAHQLLDFYPNMPAVLFAFALPIAYLDATSRRPIPMGRLRVSAGIPRQLQRGTRAGLLVAALAAIGLLAWSESIAAPADQAVAAANRRDWPVALAGAKAAVAADPSIPAYTFTLGLTAANSGDLALAATSFEQSARADDLPEAWLDLAAVRLQVGNEPGARDALARSLRLGVQQPAVDVAAAALDLRMGDRQAAADTIVEALLLAPSLAGDTFWTTDPGFAPLWPAILERSITTAAPTVAWEIALVSGDASRARGLAGQLDPDDRALAELVIDAWNGGPPAIAALESRARARPLDIPTIAWCARVTAHAGDRGTSLRYRDWASLIDGFAGGAAAEMRVVSQRGPGEAIAGSSAAWYGYYTYRRPVPDDHLVPGLPRLTYQ
jgi:O-antigen ligase